MTVVRNGGVVSSSTGTPAVALRHKRFFDAKRTENVRLRLSIKKGGRRTAQTARRSEVVDRP